MSRSYFTEWDKKIFRAILNVLSLIRGELLPSVKDWLQQFFALRRGEWVFLLILTLGVAIRLCGFSQTEVLPEEVRRVRETLGLLSFSNHFKYHDISFYSFLLILPTMITFVLGCAKMWFSAPLLYKIYGISLLAYPYAVQAGRYFNLFLFALTLFFLFHLGRRFFNERVGLWAAFLLALTPISIQVSRFVLPENLVLFLSVLLCWAFLARRFLLFGLVWGLLSATTFHGIFLSPFIFIGVLFLNRKGALWFLISSLAAYWLASFYAHLDIPLRLDAIAYAWQQRLPLVNQPKLFVICPEDWLWVLIPIILFFTQLMDRLWLYRRSLALLFVAGYFVFLIPDLAASLKNSPAFAARLKPRTEAIQPFSPGDWSSHVLGPFTYNIGLIDSEVKQAYSIPLIPFSLQEKSREMIFVAKWPKLKEIIFAMQNQSGKESEVKLLWPNGELFVGSLQAKKGWQDVVFAIPATVESGKEVRFYLQKTKEPIDLFYTQRNILLEQGAAHDPELTVKEQQTTEVLFKVVYAEEAKK